jgi:hypothetical protein
MKKKTYLKLKTRILDWASIDEKILTTNKTYQNLLLGHGIS